MRAVVLFPLGGGAAPAIDISGVGHFPSPSRHHAVVNVNNIYIDSPTIGIVKRAVRGVPPIIFGILFRAAPRTAGRYRRGLGGRFGSRLVAALGRGGWGAEVNS